MLVFRCSCTINTKGMTEKNRKILIMEDEKPMARALEMKLTHAGFFAQAVFDGKEGLALLQKEKFDMVLLDLMMPKMDGFRVLENMRNAKINTPVIILSNLSQAEDEEKARQLGAQDFFVKSNTPISVIVERVTNALS